jgi:hypothetical protein
VIPNPFKTMTSRYSLFFTALLTGAVLADVPRSPSPSRYKDLYLQSAFTDPPPVEEPELIPNDLPDWVLVGLSKYTDGVKVKLMNKKDRSRVTIPSDEATKMGFKIKGDVKQDRNFIDGAVVTVQKGTMTGEVRFDPQFLVLKKVAAPAVAQKNDKPKDNPKSQSRKAPPTPKTRVPTPSSTKTPKQRYVPRPK